MSVELISKFTEAEARQITDELVADYTALRAKIADAWRGRVWLALGYADWQEYVDQEFQNVSLRPPKELQAQVIAELSAAGKSIRGIATATDMGRGTIERRLTEVGVPNGTPTEVTGLDGKTYARNTPRKPSAPPAPTGEPTVGMCQAL